MKERFKEYRQFTEGECKQLCQEAIFVLDTNTLLNMYRYSQNTVSDYFRVLFDLKEKSQLRIPYQVGYEFFENRIDVISYCEKSYDKILNVLEKSKGDIQKEYEKIQKDYKNHPFLDFSEIDIKKELSKGLSSLEKKIKSGKKKHPQLLNNDGILEKINNLFMGIVGEPYPKKRILEIEKDGEDRYKEKIPPGFEDVKKESNKYGDLILWYQVLDMAKQRKKSVIFVSGDVKEDWWLIKHGEKIMPHPQLKKEMYDIAGVDFHIYTMDTFGVHFGISKKGTDEVKSLRNVEVRRYSSNGYSDYVSMIEDFQLLFNDLELLFSHLGHYNFALREMLQSSFERVKYIRDRVVYHQDVVMGITPSFLFSPLKNMASTMGFLMLESHLSLDVHMNLDVNSWIERTKSICKKRKV